MPYGYWFPHPEHVTTRLGPIHVLHVVSPSKDLREGCDYSLSASAIVDQ